MIRFIRIALPCLLLTLVVLTTDQYAQTATATLSGTVQDQNGAAIPAAVVSVENTATRIRRDTTTNENGYFTAPLLPPGEYTLLVRRDGFASVQVPHVILNV